MAPFSNYSRDFSPNILPHLQHSDIITINAYTESIIIQIYVGVRGGGLVRAQKGPKKEKTGCIKLQRQLCCQYGCGLMKSALPNHLMGSVQGFLMVPCRKSRLAPLSDLAGLMALGWRLVPFNRPKKSWAPRKVEIFCKGPLRSLELAPLSDLAGLIS